jgi:DNA-directed RNA polymerase specialized sigma24 family protein
MFTWKSYRQRRRLRRAFETMASGPRDVIERLLFDGDDYHRIAADLGLSVAQVERAVADAMFHLSAPDVAESAHLRAWLCRLLRRVLRR